MEKKIVIALYCVCFFNCALGIPTEYFFRAIKNCRTTILPPTISHIRIVGGIDVEHGDYPWMVSLHEKAGGGFGHLCGGSVLNENWIITAAHCVEFADDPSSYQILVGLHKRSQPNAATVQKIKISKIEIHEGFDDDTFANDIALLRTAKPIDFAGSKGYVGAIYPSRGTADPFGYARVLGWGLMTEDGKTSDTLKVAKVRIVPRDECDKAYGGSIDENMICAGESQKDSCQDDSGGPLFQTDNKNVSTLIGLVSHGAGCGRERYPGVYTKVSSFINWIDQIVSN